MAKQSFELPAESDGLRLDQALARHIEQLSRRTAKIALDVGCVFVNDKRIKAASRTLRAGDRVVAHLEGAFERALRGEPERALELSYAVLFEDEHLVVVDKPSGLLTAPTPEGDRNNLERLLGRRDQRRERVFTVHRLDLQTSGILVFAKSALANRKLSEVFRAHTITRKYDAFVLGQVAFERTSVSAPIRGKHAKTHFERLEAHAEFSWLEATLETGRTHQIRLHAQGLGHPVLSDPAYGERAGFGPPRLALHAKHLGLVHPASAEPLEFDAALPQDLATWLAAARGPATENGDAAPEASEPDAAPGSEA